MSLDALAGPATQKAFEVAVNFLWQGTLIALLAWAAAMSLARRAAVCRYGIYAMALLALALCPIATLLFDGLGIHLIRYEVLQPPATPPASMRMAAGWNEVSAPVPAAPATAAPAGRDFEGPPGPAFPTAAGLQEAPEPVSPSSPPDPTLSWKVVGPILAPVVASVWLLGAAVLLTRVLLDAAKLGRLSRGAKVVEESDWLAALRQLAGQLGISRRVRLAVSKLVSVPTTIGVLEPLILLPAFALTGYSPGDIEVALAHELAHLKRCDYLVNLFQRLVEACLFFHPAVWLVSRAVRVERENCCDDLALSLVGDAPAYARSLTRFAELARQDAPASAVGVIRFRTRIARRVVGLLRRGPPLQVTLSRRLLAVMAGTALAALLILGSSTLFGPPSSAEPSAEPANEPDELGWGEAANGLRLSIRPTKTSYRADESPEFHVALQNVGDADLALNLGFMLANGKKQYPEAIRLLIIDSSGKKRELQIMGPPGVAGRMDDFIVPLPAGGSYALRASLEDYCCPATREYRIKLGEGQYEIAAVYEGKGAQAVNLDMEGIRLLPFWTGKVTSATTTFKVAGTAKDAGAHPPAQAPAWGEAVSGLQCDARPLELKLPFGEDPRFEVTLTNTTDQPIDVIGPAYMTHGGEPYRRTSVHFPCASVRIEYPDGHYSIQSWAGLQPAPTAVRIDPGKWWVFELPPRQPERPSSRQPGRDGLPGLSALLPGIYTAEVVYFIRDSEKEKLEAGLRYGEDVGELEGKKPDRLWEGVVYSKLVSFEVLEDDSEELRILRSVYAGEGIKDHLQLELTAAKTRVRAGETVRLSLTAHNTGPQALYLGNNYGLYQKGPRGEWPQFGGVRSGKPTPIEPEGSVWLLGWNVGSGEPLVAGEYHFWVVYCAPHADAASFLAKSNVVTISVLAPEGEEPQAQHSQSPAVAQAEDTKEPGTAELAIMVLEYPDRREVVHLPNDYGYLIEWNDAEPPAFCLYNRPAGRITRTLDFTEFLAGLKEFPTGAKVDRIRGCAGGFSWAMPHAERQRVQAILEEKRFRLTDEVDGNFVICTCETKDVTLLKPPTPSPQPHLTAGRPEHAWEFKVAATGEVIPVPGEESIPLQTAPWGPERSGLHSRVTTWSEVEQGMLLRGALELRCVPDRLPDGVTHLNTYLYEEFLELSLKSTETEESFAVRPYDPTRGLLPADVGESVASLDGRPLELWRADFPRVRLRGSLEPGVYQGVVAYSFPEERTKLWGPRKDWESFGFWHGTVTSGPFQIRVLKETPKTKQLLLPLRLRYSEHERKVYYTSEDATPVEVPVRNGCFLGTQLVGRGREMLRGGVIRPDDANGIDNSVDLPKNGRVSYTIEVFETSDPPCHLWNPHLSGDHRVLWRRTLTVSYAEKPSSAAPERPTSRSRSRLGELLEARPSPDLGRLTERSAPGRRGEDTTGAFYDILKLRTDGDARVAGEGSGHARCSWPVRRLRARSGEATANALRPISRASLHWSNRRMALLRMVSAGGPTQETPGS